MSIDHIIQGCSRVDLCTKAILPFLQHIWNWYHKELSVVIILCCEPLQKVLCAGSASFITLVNMVLVLTFY